MNVAALDIGTNSVRLLIRDERGAQLERHMQITRLGQGLGVSGSLQPDAIARTLAVLAEYGELIRRHGVTRVRAAATSAARDAANSSEFFERAQAALGTRPELLPGEEEARLAFLGATCDVAEVDGPFLVVDIGGGSSEFVLGSTQPEALISIDVGCVRMAERFLHSDPASPAELSSLTAAVSAELTRVRQVIPVERAKSVIGLAGTITAIAALQQGLRRYDAAATHHARLTRAQVEAQFQKLVAADLLARRQLLAEPKRAEVIVAGAAILVSLLRDFQIPELLVSESDILDGLAASLLPAQNG